MSILEQKTDTMFEIINNIVKEIFSIKNSLVVPFQNNMEVLNQNIRNVPIINDTIHFNEQNEKIDENVFAREEEESTDCSDIDEEEDDEEDDEDDEDEDDDEEDDDEDDDEDNVSEEEKLKGEDDNVKLININLSEIQSLELNEEIKNTIEDLPEEEDIKVEKLEEKNYIFNFHPDVLLKVGDWARKENTIEP
jgi:hypothetical protein